MFGKWRKKLQIIGDDVPSVDVIVPCCKERIDIIQDTILAVIAADYPSNRRRIIVSDDGASPELAAWLIEIGIPNLYYTARKKNGPEGYKAGNLNHAVNFSRSLPGGSAKYIAGLDADMVVEKRWLRSVMAHLLLDPEVGVVCPTQASSCKIPKLSFHSYLIFFITSSISTMYL
jgi:cellulose synthase/poly-beta-1,6-N-acetylglucosamine synthase-like glycosyltransferase